MRIDIKESIQRLQNLKNSGMNRKLLLSFLSLIILTGSLFGQVPTITSFSPSSAEVGDAVTITGTNFSTTASDNIIYFGGIKATVNSATANSLNVTVPSGSTHDAISVVINGKVAQSGLSFHVINNEIASRSISNGNFGTNYSIASIQNFTNNLWSSSLISFQNSRICFSQLSNCLSSVGQVC